MLKYSLSPFTKLIADYMTSVLNYKKKPLPKRTAIVMAYAVF